MPYKHGDINSEQEATLSLHIRYNCIAAKIARKKNLIMEKKINQRSVSVT